MENWAQREAFLVLREREAQGLEPVSKDLIPVERMQLPTEEELGETHILI